MTTDLARPEIALEGKATSGGLLISGDAALSDEGKSWKVVRIDRERLIAFESSSQSKPNAALGFARCSAEMLYDLIVGLNHRRWTGMVFADNGFGCKRLYFKSGEFVFAGSDLMDDRLGEVIYRDGLITLDQLTHFAVQVDRKTKFGQVLLKSGNFNNIDLWKALKLQMKEIFRSLFLTDGCYIEVLQGAPPLEISFENGTESLLDSSYSFGVQFRSFSKRVKPEVVVIPNSSGRQSRHVKAGTFLGDMLEICKDSPTIQNILEQSKLANINTLVTIQELMAKGLIGLDGLSDPSAPTTDGRFGNFKSVIDGYQMLLDLTFKAFERSGTAFPDGELAEFAMTLNDEGGSTIYLNEQGALTTESILHMLHQCASNSHRIVYFQARIESLSRYLLQMAGDTLPDEFAFALKKSFKEISS